jgi:hypothetical protein
LKISSPRFFYVKYLYYFYFSIKLMGAANNWREYTPTCLYI